MVKKRLGQKDFYLKVLFEFTKDTNIIRIKKTLGVTKQNLNYYIAKLCKLGFLESKGNGWYEVTEMGKNPTKYGKHLSEDSVRGHAYIWNIKIEKIPHNWNDRIEVLKQGDINYNLVGALKTTPRIKILGRKVWLCNDHIRIFDKEKASYYGETAEVSQRNGLIEAFKILRVLENKLNIRLNPDKITFVKEHYALIKNSLAIHHNEKKIIMRIEDEEDGEWLLIDDSFGEGGELETTGKKAFKTNPIVQNWWNSQKRTEFKVTPEFILEALNNFLKIQENNNNKFKQMEEFHEITNIQILKITEILNKK